MPRYYNSTNLDVALGRERIGARSYLDSNEIFETANLPAGVSRVSDSPSYNPILLDQNVVATGYVDIPAGITSFKVFLLVENGTWEVRYNTNAMAPAMTLIEGQSKEIPFRIREVEKLHFTGTGNIRLRIEVL